MSLILRRKPPRQSSRHAPLARVSALDPHHPLIVRQERAYGPHRVYDLRFNQFVGPSFSHWCEAEAHKEQMLELYRLTPAAHTWTAADEAAVRRVCS